jgi:hypothetical protein
MGDSVVVPPGWMATVDEHLTLRLGTTGAADGPAVAGGAKAEALR